MLAHVRGPDGEGTFLSRLAAGSRPSSLKPKLVYYGLYLPTQQKSLELPNYPKETDSIIFIKLSLSLFYGIVNNADLFFLSCKLIWCIA